MYKPSNKIRGYLLYSKFNAGVSGGSHRASVQTMKLSL
jgi:hypothetical protein